MKFNLILRRWSRALEVVWMTAMVDLPVVKTSSTKATRNLPRMRQMRTEEPAFKSDWRKRDYKGRYILTADDPEIRDILRKGIERQKEDAGVKKSRVRFRDLVFTRQFTTFDRQNPSASQSPFFGFFTLFWIAMVLMFVQVSMHNYRDYGNILGTNQMNKMMFSHDVLVLGLTDGVMCAGTAQGLLFQRLVHKGWLRWERGRLDCAKYLAVYLPGCRDWMDKFSRMAMDTHNFHCSTWASVRDEAT